PDGLLVPVIRDVDRKSLLQLAAEAADLADKARNKKLSADAMQGACFTISSLGHIGGTVDPAMVVGQRQRQHQARLEGLA
ncbi:2-oxo acid dehydrogenase subunit E2, partial [Pseudomonas aeruginosa]